LNVLLKKRISRYLTVIATTAFMAACSTSQPPENIPEQAVNQVEMNAAYYLEKDEQLGDEKNLVWRFLAVRALIDEKQYLMADAVIGSLKINTLTAEQSALLSLLSATSLYAQEKLEEAQIVLGYAEYTYLNQDDFTQYLKLQASLYMSNELPLAASETLLLLTPRLTIDAEKQQYNDLLFDQLIQLASQQLNQYQPVTEDIEVQEITTENGEQQTEIFPAPIAEQVINAQPFTIDQKFKEGWYALAAIYQKNRLRPDLMNRQLDHWKIAYSEHPALQFMPLALTNISELRPYQPENIALILPLSGRYEKQGKAVQLGLLTAYYQQQKMSGPNEALILPKLHFFDSKTAESEQLAAQLKSANIDFVVGPLMKKEIQTLLPLIEDMPVLALNSMAEKAQPVNNDADIEAVANTPVPNTPVQWHYAFPLSPEDEAKQAASLIHSNQHKKPLIIVPDSSYGKRVASAFITQWAQLTPDNNVPAEIHYFSSKVKLASFIDDVLHTDKSKSRIQQMKAITNIPLETEVRSRRDTDAIYIVSKRDELILLKPFIDVSVSPFASKIPLYASSRSHSLDRNNMQNKELSGLVFSDNHFLLEPESELSREVEDALKKQSFAKLRLFSLGYDSYQLIEQLIYLQSNADAVYKGLIGDLSLGLDNNIQAKLSWATYQNGALIEITSPITAE